MVEGPQCNLKARKLATTVVGQRVRRVRLATALNAKSDGVAFVGAETASAAATKETQHKLPGLLEVAGAVLRVISIGKECFVVFAECVLRLHFGMAGSQYIRTGVATPLPTGSRKQLTMTLEFERCSVDFFDCMPPSIRTFRYLALVEARVGRDVIAKEFDRSSVIEHLRSDRCPAYDALMDQVSFPGVGNVIKCEALHEAAISPMVVLSELPAARLGMLVDVARAFAQRWHEACKRGAGITKRVYGVTVCTCGAQISLVRAGDKNRITYFCPVCQSREASLTQNIARRGGCLLGWVQCVDSSGNLCVSQDMGGASVIDLEHKTFLEPDVQNGSGGFAWACTRCTVLNAGSERYCHECLEPRAGTVLKSVAGVTTAGIACNNGGQLRAKRSASEISAEVSSVCNGAPMIAPSCRCGLLGKLQRVRKDGANHGRLFWSCAKRKEQSCGAFLWADGEFPMCKCLRKATMRRVLKPGQTNGRYFFSCVGGSSEKKGSQGCGFFSWAPPLPYKGGVPSGVADGHNRATVVLPL